MRRLCKIVILLLVMTALPLRGYAAVAAHFCAQHHEEVAVGHASHHPDSSRHEDAASGKDSSSTSPSCSHCASCSVGVVVAHEGLRMTRLSAAADRIPFVDARKPGHVPDHLERPPLVS